METSVPRRIELAYQKLLRKLLVPLLPKRKPGQTYQDWIAELKAVSAKRETADQAAKVAANMARWVNVINARSWRAAAAKSQRAAMLYRMLQKELQGPVGVAVTRIIRENAKLISSLPRHVAESLAGEIARAQQAGARPETIERLMRQRFPALTRNRIKLIARTETMKASSALTEARSEDLELPAYEWLTSEDQRVRPSHRKMDSVLVLWKDPPSPEALIGEKTKLGHYHAGQAPNCRCTQNVILTLDDVRWPHRVYSRGRIHQMTRVQFAQLSGITERRSG